MIRTVFKITLFLKIDENDNPYFEYTSTSESGKKSEELLFKKEIGNE